jgi:hypothetical protein
MLFAKGTRVRLLHSSDFGVVTDILDKELVMVRLDSDGIDIPVFTEDLESVIANKIIVPDRIIPDSTPELPPAQTQYAILKSHGPQLAFDPIGQGIFKLYLINDTSYALVYHLTYATNGKIKYDQHGKLDGPGLIAIGDIHIDELNDQPECQVNCQQVSTEGLLPICNKTLKIKPKAFFAKITTAPILNKSVHLFKLLDLKDTQANTKQESEDLRTYTIRNNKLRWRQEQARQQKKHEVMELAQFSPELDLHIENLVSKPGRLSNADVLREQLAHFERYLDKAYTVGAERVFVIHGVGKGKLRDAIATRLMQNNQVKTFNNDYHPRYGFGATEIIFK